MRSALALASGDLAHLMTQPWKAMGMLGFGAAAVSWHQTGDAGDIGALHPFGIRREDTRQSDLHHQDRCSSTTGHSCFYGPHQLCQSRALYKHHPQLPPPGMRPWGSWLVTSKVLSHMCSPQTLQQHAWGPHNSTQIHLLPTTMGRRAAIQHHKEVLLGPSLPLHQAGKTGAPGVAAACPDLQQDAAARYRRGGVAAPATCPLQAGTGTAPPLTPSLPPSLPPSKKTFHKPPRDGGNSERPCAPGACPNHNTQVPGHQPQVTPRTHG